MTQPRVLIAGMGDTGVLTAIGLARHADVVGVSVKPALVSGQELGWRLARPDDWARHYRIGYGRFRGLDRVRTVHARLTGLDPAERCVTVALPDGSSTALGYDALVIATGVRNGFWRQPTLQTAAQIDEEIRHAHRRVADAQSVIVVGGGAAAVSSAAQIALAWPDKRVDLYFPGSRALTGHHARTWNAVRRRLIDAGVGIHPGHRAQLPPGFAADELTGGPVHWSTGQPPSSADVVLWTIGRVTPNTAWLPDEYLDPDGFVRVTDTLQVPGHPDIFAVGDVAATDPLRSSARNRADGLVVHNVRAFLGGASMRRYRPPARRWGSVLGLQPDGLEVFTPNGRAVRVPVWAFEPVLMRAIVRRGIYRGIRGRESAVKVVNGPAELR
ncbi:FAD-dependent oxidoreductase [Mycobacterium sp. pV006]|uniref:FAD-dependent oxidoreductase n=1 Tax=Mycobacterium sp. pV006 TaxID=3238983 RepID=UPI00351BD631